MIADRPIDQRFLAPVIACRSQGHTGYQALGSHTVRPPDPPPTEPLVLGVLEITGLMNYLSATAVAGRGSEPRPNSWG